MINRVRKFSGKLNSEKGRVSSWNRKLTGRNSTVERARPLDDGNEGSAGGEEVP